MKKKRLLIPYVLATLSLAFGASLAIAQAPREVKQVKADESGYIFVGGVNMYTTPSAFGGQAVLNSSGSSHILTLNGYNQSAVTGLSSADANIVVQSITKPLIIQIQGTCTLAINSTSKDSAYGIYAVSSPTSSLQIDIVGQGTNPQLNIQTPNLSNRSCPVMIYNQYGNGTVNINNVKLTATAGTGRYSYGLDLDTCNLNVGGGADVTVTTGGVRTGLSDEIVTQTAAIIATSYYQIGGTVKATAGPGKNRGGSVGLKTTGGSVTLSGCRLEAKGSDTEKRESIGIYVDNGNLLLGDNAEVVAGAGTMSNREEGARSYGVNLHNPTGHRVQFGNNASYLYAYSSHPEHIYARGININVVSYHSAYLSNQDIFTDPNPEVLEPGEHTHVEYWQVLFQNVRYQANADPVPYDGTAHEALSLSVTYPTNSTLKYRVKGATEWSSTVPSFTDANESGYTVEFSISHEKFITVIDEAVFVINKVSSSIVVAPTKGDDFTFDDEPHALATAGEAEGGTIVYSVNGGDYSSEIPTTSAAGEYTILYKVAGDNNHNDTAPVSLGTVVVTKGNASVTTAPTLVADFTADGQAHALVVAGVAQGGTIVYSVNDGDYSATIPTASEAGSYSVSYKVQGDVNHNDTAPVSLGSVTVAEAPVPPTPSDNGSGLPGWAIALIVVGSLLLACCAAIVLLFVFWPRYVVDSANKVIIRTIFVFKKDDKVYLVSNKCKLVKAEKANVYKTKEEAEKALNK